MRNKYLNRAKISEAKFRELVRFFSIDLTAIQITELTGLNRNTVNRYLTEIRKKILNYTQLTSPLSQAQLPRFNMNETDEFCILVREFETKIYTELIPQEIAFINGKLRESDLLMDSDYELIIHVENGNHIFLGKKSSDANRHRIKLNRIESFWGNAKSRLTKFKGMHSSTFRYHVKECEFRFNNRNKDLYQLLLKILRKDPLF